MRLFKKIRFYVWLLKGIINRHTKVIVLGFIVGICLTIFGLKLGPALFQAYRKDQKIIGLVGKYTPTSLPPYVEHLISTGLTEVSPDGQVKGAIATSWDVSVDGKTYTFNLRNDVFWHDGSKFTAYDVNYNLKDVEFSPQDQTKILVKLKDPFAPLPNFLAKPLFKKGLIGVGSYKIQTIKLKGENISRLVLVSTQNLPDLEIKIFPSETIAKTAFKLGEVTMLDEMSQATPFSQWKTAEVIEAVMYNQYLGIFFNVDDVSLKEKEFRQALAYSFEKSEKNRVATPLSSASWAYSNRVKLYDSDIEQAKKLLKGMKIPEEPFTFSTFSMYLTTAQRIASSWEALGVKTKIKVVDTPPTDFQILLASQEIPADPDQYPMWHSTQNLTNITNYASPKIDKLLEDGRKVQDLEKRKKIYFDFQRYLVEDAPAIFLFHPTTYTIIRK